MKRKGYKKHSRSRATCRDMARKQSLLSNVSGKIGKVFRIIFCVALVAALVSTGESSSFFSDSETVGVSISAATLDMELRSGQPNFSPAAFADNLKPGDSLARDIYVGKTDSSLPLQYEASVSKDDSCDTNLFDALELQVFYNFYIGTPTEPNYHQNRTMTSVYSGNLSGFVLNDSTFDQNKLQIPNDNRHFNNKFYKENEHWLYFNISLPSDASENVQLKNCKFNFDFKAWQTDTDGTTGFSDEESIANEIGGGDWTAPEKIDQMTIFKGHNSNPENKIACDGFTNDTKIRIDWEESTASDIDYYWFGNRTNTRHKKIDASESHYDVNMTPGKESYRYTVIAVDTNGNESEISEPCGDLTLDQDAPIISFDNLPSVESLSGNFEILGALEDTTPTTYTVTVTNMDDDSLETTSENIATPPGFSVHPILNWDTTESENGEYEVVFEAIDSAGNSATISAKFLVENQTDDDIPNNDEDEIQPRDVIINEVMWMGSQNDAGDLASADEWLELRNTTNHDIDIKNWNIYGIKKGGHFEISGGPTVIIPANGYFLISEKNKDESRINVNTDRNTNTIDFENNYSEHEKIILKNSAGVIIDQTPENLTSSWPAGKNENHMRWSMERNVNDAGDGTEDSDWHTCDPSIMSPSDLETMQRYWDDNAKSYNCGTPGHENLSKNDPTSPDYDPAFQKSAENMNANFTAPLKNAESEGDEVPENQTSSSAKDSTDNIDITPLEKQFIAPVIKDFNAVPKTAETQPSGAELLEKEDKKTKTTKEPAAETTEELKEKTSQEEIVEEKNETSANLEKIAEDEKAAADAKKEEEKLEQEKKEAEEDAKAEKLAAEKKVAEEEKEKEEKKAAEEEKKKEEAALAKQEEKELAKKAEEKEDESKE